VLKLFKFTVSRVFCPITDCKCRTLHAPALQCWQKHVTAGGWPARTLPCRLGAGLIALTTECALAPGSAMDIVERFVKRHQGEGPEWSKHGIMLPAENGQEQHHTCK
jgi:hypothetical protein